MIKVYDNLIDKETQARFLSECKSQEYNIDVTDVVEDANTASGCSSAMSIHTYMYNKLKAIIDTNISEVAGLELYDCHVNCFFPREVPNFHTDNESDGSITLLYYANTNNYTEGGTEILDKDNFEVRSILPRPGRIVIFPGNCLHRATSFRDKKRFTVAFKYRP